MRSLPRRSLSALTVMNLSLAVFMSVFLVVVLKIFIFKFGIGAQKLSSLVSRHFFTNVSICSQPFSVLSIKFFAMSVGKTTHVAKLRSSSTASSLNGLVIKPDVKSSLTSEYPVHRL